MKSMRFLNTVFAVLLAMSCMSVNAEEVDYRPVINGTVRAKYEYEPQISAGRFEVRNCPHEHHREDSSCGGV